MHSGSDTESHGKVFTCELLFRTSGRAGSAGADHCGGEEHF